MVENKPSSAVVFEAVTDLHNLEQIVTRETLHSYTGLKLSVIDDRLKMLVEQEKIVRVQRGVFVPAMRHPPARVVSKTLLPDGTVKIDIGDQVLTLTPREDRMLAQLFAGVAVQSASVELGHHSAIQSGEMNRRLNQVERILSKSVK